MNTIKHILTRYTAFLWALLKPLGPWGVFVVAALDGAALGLPMDVVVAGYVAQNHSRFLLYVLMAASGSAIGSLVIYAIGYAGGEELLRKRVSAERFEKLHAAFEKHPFWSLMFPAMWMQEGVVNEAAAATARKSGIFVAMDRCILKEHKARFG